MSKPHTYARRLQRRHIRAQKRYQFTIRSM